jgi:hypothetical protein
MRPEDAGRGMELAGPAIDRMGAAGRCASRPVLSLSLSLFCFFPRCQSRSPLSISLSAGDALDHELGPRRGAGRCGNGTHERR